MEIKLNIDTESLSKKLNQLQKKQLPFASAKAITDTLKNNVKPAALNEAKKTFKIKTGWILKGIRIIPAKKGQFPNFRAGIGTKDDVVRQNALGETRTSQISKPFTGNKLAVPTRFARKKFGNRLSNPSIWASSLASKKTKKTRYFIETENGQDVGLSMVSGRNIWRLYTLRDSLKVKKKFQFERVAHVTFRRHIKANFNQALAYALSTAR